MGSLVESQTVYRLGRKRAQHAWSVHVVGDDASGYVVQVRTRCGVVLSGNDEAAQIEGFVTCEECAS